MHLRVVGSERSPLATAVLEALDDATLDELADLLAPRLVDRVCNTNSPWMNAEEAARYLATSKDRVYDLVQLRKLDPRRDGRRLLFRRADLDGYLDAAA